MEKLAKSKINIIRRCYLKGRFSGAKLAVELHLLPHTVYKYRREFREIERLYPHKLKDFTFMLPRMTRQGLPKSSRYDELIKALPGLVDNARTLYLDSVSLWKDYRNLYPNGYCQDKFLIYYRQWK